MSLLGIDVGTTGCKAIAFNVDGKIIAQAYGEYPLIHQQPGWSELDSKQVWDIVANAIKKVVAQTKFDPVEAFAVSSQGEAVTPVSKSGEILDNAITTFDYRTAGIDEEIGEKMSKLDIMKITGMPLSPVTTAAKLIWVKRTKPEVYKNTWKFLGFEDFIVYKMGLAPIVDYSLASRTMLFDIINKNWSENMFDLTGLDVGMFPEAKPSGRIIGEVPASVAEELGLPKGVVGVTGGHDQPCGALGAGIIRSGEVMDATGTVECVAPAFNEPVINENMIDGNFCCYCHVVDGLYVTLAFVASGGVLLRWYRDTFAQAEKAEAEATGKDVYDIMMEQVTDGVSPVVLLPHFTGSGTPYLDSGSKGAILGLSLAATKGDIIKAILEGISFEIKLNLEMLSDAGVTINEIRAIGGGAKSEKWLQLKADMFGKNVVALNVSEGVCLGAIILAGTAIGKYPSVQEAVKQLVKPKKTYLPREDVKKQYDERLKLYAEIYPAIQKISRKL